jgi:beta-glucosidase
MKPMALPIPSSLHFGIADSDLQVVGEQFSRSVEGSSKSIWQTFSEKEGAIEDHSSPAIASDRYHRWREDAELVANLGVTRYRTSVSMSRVLCPDGNSINNSALDWYQNYFDSLIEKGVAIDVTLYHWELPQFLEDAGGWTNPTTITAFLKHVETVVTSLGSRISSYFILNEPWCSGWLGYAEGVHAPGIKNTPLALQAIHHLLLAQARALRLIRELSPSSKISTAYNLSPFYPASNSEEDQLARDYADCNVNRWYMDPLYRGEYPQPLLDLFADKMPKGFEADMDEIRVGGQLDSLGINYYSGGLVNWNAEALCRYSHSEIIAAEKNGLGWPVFTPPACPPGLLELLRSIYGTYQPFGLKAIDITENGTAWGLPEKGASCNDEFRVRYLHQHLEQLAKAISEDIPVHTYYLWTLLDNFEWAFGYQPKSNFGLVHVDWKSMERTPKKSYDWFRDVLQSRELKACDVS